MAFAPAVSIEYWQELADRRATLSLQQEREDAALCAIVANQLEKATEFFADREEYEDAKLVRSLQIKGVFTNVLTKVTSKGPSEATPCKFTIPDEVMAKLVKQESEDQLFQRQCCQAAATYLSVNDFRHSVQTLVRGNELYLAQIVANRYCPEVVSEITSLLGERAEKLFCADLALELSSICGKRQVELTKRRLINSGLLKDMEGLESKYGVEAQN